MAGADLLTAPTGTAVAQRSEAGQGILGAKGGKGHVKLGLLVFFFHFLFFQSFLSRWLKLGLTKFAPYYWGEYSLGVSCPEPRWVPAFSPQPLLLLLLSSHWLNAPFFCSWGTASRSSAARCIFAVRGPRHSSLYLVYFPAYLAICISSSSLPHFLYIVDVHNIYQYIYIYIYSMLQVGRTGRMGEQAAGEVLFHLQGRRRAQPWLLRLQHKVCYLHERDRCMRAHALDIC
jgi:hypothetical protein